MAIERYSGGGNLERRVGIKQAAKKGIKQAAKKAPAKKHAAKHEAKHAAGKHAAKHGREERITHAHREEAGSELGKAFHHLGRAAALISLVDESGEDLRRLLEHGVRVYRIACGNEKSGKGKKGAAAAAVGLSRAAEHLSLAGLYAARAEHRVKVPAPGESDLPQRLVETRQELEDLPAAKGENSRWLAALAAELVRRGMAEEEPHLAWEYTVAAEGLCMALAEGM